MERQWTGNPRRLSQADLAEIERLIWGGETFATAAAAVGCSTRSIQRFLALSGGLKRRVKERSALRLSLAEREELSRGLVAGDSLRSIARRLRRAPSTISREVAWNGPRQLSSVAGGRRGEKGGAPTQTGEAGGRLKVVPGSLARPTRTLVSPTDRRPADL